MVEGLYHSYISESRKLKKLEIMFNRYGSNQSGYYQLLIKCLCEDVVKRGKTTSKFAGFYGQASAFTI